MTPVAANPDLTAHNSIPQEEAQLSALQPERQNFSEPAEHQSASSACAPESSPAVEFLNRIGLIEKMAPIRLLNREIRQEHPQLDELYKIIEASTDLTKRFLKFANSPWFNSRVQVDSPMMAFSRFGTEGFYRLALATFLQDSIGELSTKFRIWPHLEWSARAAEMVAQQLAPKYTDEVFVAGILHDALVAPMERELQDYLYFLECALNMDPVVTGLEKTCHEFNHAEAAAELAKALEFETSIVEAIRVHHNERLSEIEGDARVISALLFITKRALSIARAQRKVAFETVAEKALLRDIAAALGCSTGRVINVISDVVENLHLPTA
jgi:HD-like signal output (HDOD) protein